MCYSGRRMRTAVIATNAQLDYFPDGALATPGSERIVSELLRYRPDLWIASRRQYPPDYDQWGYRPPHCIKGTRGARLHAALDSVSNYVITQTGFSAFEGGTLRPLRPLEDILKDGQIDKIIIGGFFLEEEVAQTAFDANALGYETRVDLAGSQSSPYRRVRGVIEKLEYAGVTVA